VKRRHGIVIGILLAAVVAGGVVAAFAFTGSSQRAAVLRQARGLLGEIPIPKKIHFRTRAKLPDLSARALNRFERTGLNEKTPGTREHAAGERALSSSAFPQTRVLPTGGRGRMRVLTQSLIDKGHAIFIAEPDVATNGRRVMVTWNDGAAFSKDGGRHFRFVNPATAFPKAHDGFCCDQVSVYAPAQNLWLWALQYWEDATGNILRLAVGRGNAGFDRHVFQLIDLSPSSYGFSQTANFDYPDLGLTKNNLLLTVNTYDEDSYVGTLVLRIPLADLALNTPTLQNARYFKTHNNTAVLTAGAKETMYILSHASSSSLQLWSWADSELNPRVWDPIAHTPYPYFGPIGYNCRRKGGPPASDWCERLLDSGPTNDDRPTTAWLSNGLIGVAWNAQQAPGRGFPYPYVMVVRIDESTKAVVDEPFIWSPKYAFQFLDMAPNGRGDLGGLVLTGGGTTYQGCAAIGRPASASGKRAWDARLTDRSDRDPSEAKAGDYLGVSPLTPTGRTWVGSCNTLHGGRGPQNEGIRFVAFSR
jgi:hypothetical protein